jgi:GT2 family glycosyltransferase
LKQIHFSNSNCAIRKDVWRSFKFDERIPYAEDILWQREVIEAGYSIVYAPDAAVYHTHRVSIRDQYTNSRKCAYALASMKHKRQSVAPIIFDVGIFMGSIPNSIFQNIRYMWRNNYLAYVKVAPLFVLSGWSGWLMGRIDYRLKK